jgi:cytochrome c553
MWRLTTPLRTPRLPANKVTMIKILIIAAATALSAGVYAGDAAIGKEKAKACAACHGENGISQAPDFPKLAGQYNDYLVRALKDYQSGTRKNAIMAGQVANLKPSDIADLAAYYSSLQALTTKY